MLSIWKTRAINFFKEVSAGSAAFFTGHHLFMHWHLAFRRLLGSISWFWGTDVRKLILLTEYKKRLVRCEIHNQMALKELFLL
jgi:hypothetical protein